jgi:antagonist of KipI
MAGTELATSPRSDRTAVRFTGEPLAHSPGEITTTGVLPGALQLPADGLPILLLGNCQTTGGYPVVGVVCSADLRLAAQLRPGTRVRLESIGLGEARELAAQAAF